MIFLAIGEWFYEFKVISILTLDYPLLFLDHPEEQCA